MAKRKTTRYLHRGGRMEFFDAGAEDVHWDAEKKVSDRESLSHQSWHQHKVKCFNTSGNLYSSALAKHCLRLRDKDKTNLVNHKAPVARKLHYPEKKQQKNHLCSLGLVSYKTCIDFPSSQMLGWENEFHVFFFPFTRTHTLEALLG